MLRSGALGRESGEQRVRVVPFHEDRAHLLRRARGVFAEDLQRPLHVLPAARAERAPAERAPAVLVVRERGEVGEEKAQSLGVGHAGSVITQRA